MATFGPLVFWAQAFYLLPVFLAALVMFRLYRARRRELWAGSLLLWRRLAAQQPRKPPKRLLLDRSFFLQAAGLALLAVALAAPSWALKSETGRTLVMVVDNAPPARAEAPGGAPLWEHVRAQARSLLRKLPAADRVILAATGPLCHPLGPAEGLPPQEALTLLAELQPALSGPAPGEILRYAVDLAHSRGGAHPLPLHVLSLRDGPPGVAPEQWHCAAPSQQALRNVALVAFGSAPVVKNNSLQPEVLVRVRNFSTQTARGSIRLDEHSAGWKTLEQQTLALPPGASQPVVFQLAALPGSPIRLAWADSAGVDAWSDDDCVVALPRKTAPPRVRFHGAAPALRQLYEQALRAQILPPDSQTPADLEVFVGSVPEQLPDGTRAVLLITPESGYRAFDVGPGVLNRPLPQRDEDDPLTSGVTERSEGLFAVPAAREILHTGDFRSLLKDARSGRTLLARFSNGGGQLGFVLAFMPGDPGNPAALIEPPLAAILVRLALQAADAGEPFHVARAAELERLSGAPLPPNWLDSDGVLNRTGGGVLDEKVSALALGTGENPQSGNLSGVALQTAARIDLAPWLLTLALALLALEWWQERPRGMAPGRPQVGPNA